MCSLHSLLYTLFHILLASELRNTVFPMVSDTKTASLHDGIVNEIVSFVGENADKKEISEILKQSTKCPLGHLTEECAELVRETIVNPLKNYKVALIVVDFQNDFVDGSLAIKNGSAGQDAQEAVAPLNVLLQDPLIDTVVYTKDWHPSNHISFYEHCRNSDRKLAKEDRFRKLRPFDSVQFDEPSVSQVLYPTHCVQGTRGAELYPQMVLRPGAVHILKGTDVFLDSYSAFFDNARKSQTPLEEILRSNNITVVLACGLAYDICVGATLRDAADLGFLSAVITDCTKGLDEANIEATNQGFREKNVAILHSEQVYGITQRTTVPMEWVKSLAANMYRKNEVNGAGDKKGI